MDKFLKALQLFRDNIDNKDEETMLQVCKEIILFIADESNNLLVLVDKEGYPLIIEIEDGAMLLTYTSYSEANKVHKNNEDVDYMLDTALHIFDRISKINSYSGLAINDGTSPLMYIPRDILAVLVACANQLKTKKQYVTGANIISSIT